MDSTPEPEHVGETRHIDAMNFIEVDPDRTSASHFGCGRRQISSTDTTISDSLDIKKRVASREVFYTQALLIYIICIACIINLSIGSEFSHVWISLLSGSAAYLLPAPKVKTSSKNTVVEVGRETAEK